MSEHALTSEQLAAVTHKDGPCLVVAGAGTGKTTVITQRIAHLIQEHGVTPDQVLALTFTDKAAGEMQGRLDELLPYGTFITTSTFHGFCNDLIRRHAYRIGINPEARLITEADQTAILREYIEQLPLRHYRRTYNPTPLLKQIAHYIENAKEAQLQPEQLITHAENAIKNAFDEAEAESAEQYLELAQCYKVAAQLYEKLEVLTYADLLRHTRDILQSSASVRKKEQDRFQYLLIDEYQDTNSIQAEIAYLLAGDRANLFVVGDDDQAIYRFRGANVKNILDFKERFPNAVVVTLTENYRSTQPILDAAYKLIQNNNPHRLETYLNISKKLNSNKEGTVEPIYLHHSTGAHEAENVASEIERLITSGEFAATDIAIIARSHNQLDPFEEELQTLKVPINRIKEGNFYQEPSVVQALAYLRFLSAPQNSENLFHLLTGEPFSIAGEDVINWNVSARKNHLSLWDTLNKPDSDLSESLSFAVQFYKSALHEHASDTPSTALRLYIHESKWQTKLVDAGEERAAIHLMSLYNQARTFQLLHQPTSVASFVDHCDRLISSGENINVQSEVDTAREGVTLITAHSSKGLEFPVVFVVNMVMRRFPLQINGGDLKLPAELITPLKDNVPHEEERRLAYVAFTRAKELLYITDAERYGANKTTSKASPFIAESLGIDMPPEFADQPLRSIAFTTQDTPDTREPLRFPSQLSASALEAFDSNPARFYEQYVMQIIPEDLVAIEFGNAVHNTLRDVLNARREHISLDIVKTFTQYWVGEGYITAEIRDEEFKEGVDMVVRYLEMLGTDYCPPLIEETLSLRLPNGFRVVGKVDCIEDTGSGHLRIVDYKTGSKSAKESDVRDNLPLAIYAAALTQQGKVVDEVCLRYLRTGSHPNFKITQSFIDTKVTYTEELVERIRSAYKMRQFPDTGKF